MTPTDVIKAFYQQGESDCATIATIKVAIAKFGIGNVFVATLTENGIYNITFKNGAKLSVAKNQVDDLNQVAGFVPNEGNGIANDIYEYALLCFGVFVANYANLNGISINDAAVTIDHGGDADHWYHYLGFNDEAICFLGSNSGTKNASDFTDIPLYLLYNKFHAVLAIGDRYDEYGIPTDVNEFVKNHSKIFSGGRMWAWAFN